MFAYGGRNIKGLIGLLLLIGALVTAGCGGDDDAAPDPASSQAEGATDGPAGEDGGSPDPAMADADPGDVEVITAWVAALSDGDVTAAAELFALPSVAENGGVVIRIESRADAVTFNETLPCGAALVGAETAGAFTTATFRLTDRPGGDCGRGTGAMAATSFVIEDGLISEWRRVGTDRGRAGGTGGRTT